MSPKAKNLSRLALKSMKKAVKKVVEEHKKNGTTLSVWKNGKVVHVSANSVHFSNKK